MVTPRRGIRSHKLPDPSSLITSLSSNDVLLGRGSPIIKFEGNISFRQIVRHRKPEYTATGQHKVKDRIAHEIYAAIQDRGGRFLRRLDSTELSKLGLAVNSKCWAIVEHAVAMEKVKQALRDREPVPKSTEAIHDLRSDLMNNANVQPQQQQPNNIMWQEALRMANDSPPGIYGIQQQQPLQPLVGGNSTENQQRMLAALLQQESMRQKARMMNQWMLMKGLMNNSNNGTATSNNFNGLLPTVTIPSLSLLQPNPTTTAPTANSTPLERLFATGSVEEAQQQQRNAVDRVV